MTQEDKIKALDHALYLLDAMLVDCEDRLEVSRVGKIYEVVNKVYIQLCEERLENKSK